MATTKAPGITSAEATEASSSSSADDRFHHVRRGELADNISGEESIDGYDAERMRARAALTAEEEKKLIRRIDWHLMPLCSIIFMFKNLDSDNVGEISWSYSREELVADFGSVVGLECANHEQGYFSKHHDAVRTNF